MSSFLTTLDSQQGQLLLWLRVYLAGTLIIFAMYWIRLRSRRFNKLEDLKEIPGLNILQLLVFGFQMAKGTDMLKLIREVCQRWGDPVRLSFFTRTTIFVSSYETAIQLLSNPNFNARSHDTDMIWRSPGGRGLSSAPAHLIRSRRKLVKEGYFRPTVEQSLHVFREESQRLVCKLEQFSDSGHEFDVMPELRLCAFRTVCRTSLGDEFIAEKSDSELIETITAYHTALEGMFHRVLSPFLWLKNDFVFFNLTAGGRRTQKATELVNKFIKEGIQNGKEIRSESRNISGGQSPSYLNVLLDVCRNEKNSFGEEDVMGEISNYIMAGYDTTAHTLAWTLFALATADPSHQDKIAKEVDQILLGPKQNASIDLDELRNNSSTIISPDDTKKLKYLENCIKETLRLFHVLPIVPRAAVDDMTLEDGRVIPANSDVLIILDAILKDPRWFPEPEKFLPNRHDSHHNPAFIPFSVGARNCIGQVYAMYNMKVQLAWLVREYRWEAVDAENNLPCFQNGVLASTMGFPFRIRKRNNEAF